MSAFDAIAARLEYPMYIVTAVAGEERAGCLIGFATQCSIDPTRFLVCVSDKNRTARVAERADALAVHLVPAPADHLVELFGGEYTHIEFQATSADDAFLITAQGMDFNDDNWSFHLEGPDGAKVYGDSHTATGHGGMAEIGCAHCCRRPHATAQRSGGRLSLLLQRDSADRECWVGRWRLMAFRGTPR